MNRRDIGMVLLCVACSVLACIGTNQYDKRKPVDILRTKKVEIVDDEGRIRGILGLVGDRASESQPRLVLRDTDGREVILLNVSRNGEGFLGFSSKDIEGVVIIGELPGSDTVGSNDNVGVWGLMVRASDGRRSSMGFLKSGDPVGLSRSQSESTTGKK
jgi:hypothetical protein